MLKSRCELKTKKTTKGRKKGECKLAKGPIQYSCENIAKEIPAKKLTRVHKDS